MGQQVKVFIATLLFCFIVDMTWLGFVAKGIYQTELATLIRKANGEMAPIWQSAVVVYLAIALGILYFVLPKFPHSYLHTLIAGALFGFVTYAIYDCTNYAVLNNWTLKITIIDILWGTFLCGASSVFALFCLRKLS